MTLMPKWHKRLIMLTYILIVLTIGAIVVTLGQWWLVTFLDDMAHRILLRRVGGGWAFIHRMVLEHFASAHTE